MRFLIIYIIVFLFSIGKAQDLPLEASLDSMALKHKQDSIFTVLNVSKMAIFPGCESVSDDKLASVACFSDKLNQELLKHMDTTYPSTSIPKIEVETKLAFITNLDGEISYIEAVKGDPEFYAQCIQAMEAAANSFRAQGLKIVPAELEDGTAVSLIFLTDITLPNPAYKKDVLVYLYEQDCTVDEIYDRLAEYKIYHLKRSHIEKWIERYKNLIEPKSTIPAEIP